MGLFSLQFRNVPDEAIYAEGGLKFRADERALRRYFAPILSRVSLNDLVGEAVFWVHLADTASIWAFPILLYVRGPSAAFVGAALIFLVAEMASRAIYIKVLNYTVFVLGNRALQLFAYGAFAVWLWIHGSTGGALALAFWLGIFWFGAAQFLGGLLLLPIHRILFSLPPSDQALRNVGFYHGVRIGLDPLKCRMHGNDDDGR